MKIKSFLEKLPTKESYVIFCRRPMIWEFSSEADPQLLVGAYPYYHPYAYAPVAVAPFVAHPNGAVVPLEPEDVSTNLSLSV